METEIATHLDQILTKLDSALAGQKQQQLESIRRLEEEVSNGLCCGKNNPEVYSSREQRATLFTFH